MKKQNKSEENTTKEKEIDKLVEVKFKFDRRAYYINSKDIPLHMDEHVIVEAEKGADMGRVSHYYINSDKLNLKQYKIFKIIRNADEKDLIKLKRIRQKEEEAKLKFQELLEKQPFKMRLVETEYQFDGNKLTFYFTAKKRVDFRNFVKDLAKVFRTRIELRQINLRQKLKYLGGFGRCGRELCCKSLNLSKNIGNLKMAEQQNVNTPDTKITGVCGQPLCCLAFENEFYKKRAQNFPEIGDPVYYKNKKMTVCKNNFLTSTVEIKDENNIRHSLSLEEYMDNLTKKRSYKKSKSKKKKKIKTKTKKRSKRKGFFRIKNKKNKK